MIRRRSRGVMAAVTVALLTSMLIATAAGAQSSGRFTDDDGNVHEGFIEAIAAEGITLGCNPEGTLYCPAATVTRGQMASFIDRGFTLPRHRHRCLRR